MRRLLVFILVFSVSAALFAQQNVSAPQKYALVIGNGNYTGISKLNNPVNDANDMETALKALGFNVEKVINGNLEQMETAILNLKRRLGASRNIYGFFFYAGHGVQSNGENYLIPVTADNIRTESQLRDRAVSLQFILDSFSEAGNELNMIVLDACRDNPFGWARSGSRGLGVVNRAPSGTVVMYAAGAGQTASDGTGKNGLFTSHLLTNLKTPSLSVFEIFDRTMSSMIDVTGGNQHPELSLRAGGTTSIYLGSRPTPSPTPSPAQPTPHIYYFDLADIISENFVRINGGTFTMGSPANEAGRENNETQRQVTVSSFYMGKYEVTQKEYQEIMGYNPSYFKGDNLPVEGVTWFDAIEYCNKRSQKEGLTPVYTITGRTPASGYPITTAEGTANWNNNGYRLPTEAEWEYACRAGTTTPFNTGNNITTNQANYDGYYPYNNNAKGTSLEKTTPVGNFAANAWGLHDMHGNVFEWCWDLYGDYASGAQTNPRGAVFDNYRVIRGGGWSYAAANTRSAERNGISPYFRSYDFGFRVVLP